MKKLIYFFRQFFKPVYPVELKNYEIGRIYSVHDKLRDNQNLGTISAMPILMKDYENRIGAVGSFVVFLTLDQINSILDLLQEYENQTPTTGFAFDQVRQKLTIAILPPNNSVYAE